MTALDPLRTVAQPACRGSNHVKSGEKNITEIFQPESNSLSPARWLRIICCLEKKSGWIGRELALSKFKVIGVS